MPRGPVLAAVLAVWLAAHAASPFDGTCRGSQEALRANGALYYRNYDEFSRCVSLLLERPDVARDLGAQGLAYVEREYRWPTVVGKIDALLRAVAR